MILRREFNGVELDAQLEPIFTIPKYLKLVNTNFFYGTAVYWIFPLNYVVRFWRWLHGQ